VRTDSLLGFLFIVYCLEAGLLFALAPWSAGWDRAALQLPWHGVRSAALHPFLRGAVTSFGVLHFVWGAHDIDSWWRRRRRAA
jgi:hypothetical protein